MYCQAVSFSRANHTDNGAAGGTSLSSLQCLSASLHLQNFNEEGNGQQGQAFNQLSLSLQQWKGIELAVNYSQTLHDREIRHTSSLAYQKLKHSFVAELVTAGWCKLAVASTSTKHGRRMTTLSVRGTCGSGGAVKQTSTSSAATKTPLHDNRRSTQPLTTISPPCVRSFRCLAGALST